MEKILYVFLGIAIQSSMLAFVLTTGAINVTAEQHGVIGLLSVVVVVVIMMTLEQKSAENN